MTLFLDGLHSSLSSTLKEMFHRIEQHDTGHPGWTNIEGVGDKNFFSSKYYIWSVDWFTLFSSYLAMKTWIEIAVGCQISKLQGMRKKDEVKNTYVFIATVLCNLM